MPEMTVADAMAVLRAQRKQVEKTCPQCGRTFAGFTVKKYCSPACSNAAYRGRKREELNAKRMEKYYRERDAGPTPPRPRGRPRKDT